MVLAERRAARCSELRCCSRPSKVTERRSTSASCVACCWRHDEDGDVGPPWESLRTCLRTRIRRRWPSDFDEECAQGGPHCRHRWVCLHHGRRPFDFTALVTISRFGVTIDDSSAAYVENVAHHRSVIWLWPLLVNVSHRAIPTRHPRQPSRATERTSKNLWHNQFGRSRDDLRGRVERREPPSGTQRCSRGARRRPGEFTPIDWRSLMRARYIRDRTVASGTPMTSATSRPDIPQTAT